MTTYTESEVLELLEKYDREFKLDTVAYTKAAKYTVSEWFEKNQKKSSQENGDNIVLFDIIPRMHEGLGQKYGAYVQRPDGKTFYLGKWSSEEKRDRLAPQVLQQKIDHPSSEFKRFMKGGSKDAQNHVVTNELDSIQKWIQEELQTTFNCREYEYNGEHSFNGTVLMLDSLDQVELIMHAEKDFKIQIPDQEAAHVTTLNELHQLIKKHLS